MSRIRSAEPDDGDERHILGGWLAFHRDALAANCDGAPDDHLIRVGLGGSRLSLLGLVRHLTEMERVYGVHHLSGGPLEFVYGPYTDDGPAGDFDDLTTDVIESSFAAWRAECRAADAHLAAMDLDEVGRGNGRTVRWNVMKLLQEYARHNGHADLIREALDGTTGE
jgi:hypothetical protein